VVGNSQVVRGRDSGRLSVTEVLGRSGRWLGGQTIFAHKQSAAEMAQLMYTRCRGLNVCVHHRSTYNRRTLWNITETKHWNSLKYFIRMLKNMLMRLIQALLQAVSVFCFSFISQCATAFSLWFFLKAVSKGSWKLGKPTWLEFVQVQLNDKNSLVSIWWNRCRVMSKTAVSFWCDSLWQADIVPKGVLCALWCACFLLFLGQSFRLISQLALRNYSSV